MVTKNRGLTIKVGAEMWGTPKTQKARGLDELRGLVEHGSSPFKVPPYITVTDPALLEAAWGMMQKAYPGKRKFGRPCPDVPRHGFVDSVRVESCLAAVELFKAARSVDPKAELILMTEVNAVANMVWTSGQLTVGPGHDGATSGKGAFMVPTVALPPVAGPYASIKDSAFFEFVAAEDAEVPNIVQLRDGPKLPSSPDCVTRKVTVKEVIRAEGDLLEWETRMKAAAGKDVAVDHSGGTLASHYAVHAVLNDVAILTTRKPVVGETLEPTQAAKGKPDKAAIGIGMTQGIEAKLTYREAALFVVAMLHNYTALDLSDRLQARLWGAACALAVRLGFAACIGEARHANMDSKFLATLKGKDRDAVYDEAWVDFDAGKRQMRQVWGIFLAPIWGGSFGGKAWARCTQVTVELWNALVLIARSTYDKNCHGNPKTTVERLNTIVNTAHNTGAFFNKFLPNKKDFDLAAENPAAAMIVAHHALRYFVGLGEQVLGNRKYSVIPAVTTPAKVQKAPAPAPSVPAAPKKPVVPTVAQCVVKGNQLHIQFKVKGVNGYSTHNQPVTPEQKAACAVPSSWTESWAGTGTTYTMMMVAPDGTLSIPFAGGKVNVGKVSA